jgi:tetratricopeptide (TPR) repeat protein
MIKRRCWTRALPTVVALTLVGCFGADVRAARAGGHGEQPPPVIEPPQSEPSQAAPSEDEQGPSSNTDSKSAREPGSREDEASFQDGEPDLSLEELHLDEPGQRAKALGELYDELGRAKNASDALPVTETIERIWHSSGSDTIDLLLSRAGSLVKGSDLDLAGQVLDAVVDLAPDNAEGFYQRAMLYFMQNDYQPALADLKRALVIDPQHYQALNGLGVLLQELGDKKGALEAFRKALQVNPFLDSARQRIEELSRSVEGQDI